MLSKNELEEKLKSELEEKLNDPKYSDKIKEYQNQYNTNELSTVYNFNDTNDTNDLSNLYDNVKQFENIVSNFTNNNTLMKFINSLYDYTLSNNSNDVEDVVKRIMKYLQNYFKSLTVQVNACYVLSNIFNMFNHNLYTNFNTDEYKPHNTKYTITDFENNGIPLFTGDKYESLNKSVLSDVLTLKLTIDNIKETLKTSSKYYLNDLNDLNKVLKHFLIPDLQLSILYINVINEYDMPGIKFILDGFDKHLRDIITIDEFKTCIFNIFSNYQEDDKFLNLIVKLMYNWDKTLLTTQKNDSTFKNELMVECANEMNKLVFEPLGCINPFDDIKINLNETNFTDFVVRILKTINYSNIFTIMNELITGYTSLIMSRENITDFKTLIDINYNNANLLNTKMMNTSELINTIQRTNSLSRSDMSFIKFLNKTKDTIFGIIQNVPYIPNNINLESVKNEAKNFDSVIKLYSDYIISSNIKSHLEKLIKTKNINDSDFKKYVSNPIEALKMELLKSISDDDANEKLIKYIRRFDGNKTELNKYLFNNNQKGLINVMNTFVRQFTMSRLGYFKISEEKQNEIRECLKFFNKKEIIAKRRIDFNDGGITYWTGNDRNIMSNYEFFLKNGNVDGLINLFDKGIVYNYITMEKIQTYRNPQPVKYENNFKRKMQNFDEVKYKATYDKLNKLIHDLNHEFVDYKTDIESIDYYSKVYVSFETLINKLKEFNYDVKLDERTTEETHHKNVDVLIECYTNRIKQFDRKYDPLEDYKLAVSNITNIEDFIRDNTDEILKHCVKLVYNDLIIKNNGIIPKMKYGEIERMVKDKMYEISDILGVICYLQYYSEIETKEYNSIDFEQETVEIANKCLQFYGLSDELNKTIIACNRILNSQNNLSKISNFEYLIKLNAGPGFKVNSLPVVIESLTSVYSPHKNQPILLIDQCCKSFVWKIRNYINDKEKTYEFLFKHVSKTPNINIPYRVITNQLTGKMWVLRPDIYVFVSKPNPKYTIQVDDPNNNSRKINVLDQSVYGFGGQSGNESVKVYGIGDETFTIKAINSDIFKQHSQFWRTEPYVKHGTDKIITFMSESYTYDSKEDDQQKLKSLKEKHLKEYQNCKFEVEDIPAEHKKIVKIYYFNSDIDDFYKAVVVENSLK